MKRTIQEIAQFMTNGGLTPSVDIVGYYYDVENTEFKIDVRVYPAEQDPVVNEWFFPFFEAKLPKSASLTAMSNHVKTAIEDEMN